MTSKDRPGANEYPKPKKPLAIKKCAYIPNPQQPNKHCPKRPVEGSDHCEEHLGMGE